MRMAASIPGACGASAPLFTARNASAPPAHAAPSSVVQSYCIFKI